MGIGESAEFAEMGSASPFLSGHAPGSSPTYAYIMDRDGSNMKPLTSALGVGGVLSYYPMVPCWRLTTVS